MTMQAFRTQTNCEIAVNEAKTIVQLTQYHADGGSHMIVLNTAELRVAYNQLGLAARRGMLPKREPVNTFKPKKEK